MKKKQKQRGGSLIFQGNLLSGGIIRAGDEAKKKEKNFDVDLFLD